MHKKLKKDGTPKKSGGNHGGGRPKGVSQTSKTFRIDNDLAEYLITKVNNQNSLVNLLIRNYKQQAEKIITQINKIL